MAVHLLRLSSARKVYAPLPSLLQPYDLSWSARTQPNCANGLSKRCEYDLRIFPRTLIAGQYEADILQYPTYTYSCLTYLTCINPLPALPAALPACLVGCCRNLSLGLREDISRAAVGNAPSTRVCFAPFGHQPAYCSQN